MLGDVRDFVAWFLNVGRNNHLQIVANLVSNALKFTPRGGDVCVTFEHLWGDGTSPEGAHGMFVTLER
jgi:signal transduction histidine kinase